MTHQHKFMASSETRRLRDLVTLLSLVSEQQVRRSATLSAAQPRLCPVPRPEDEHFALLRLYITLEYRELGDAPVAQWIRRLPTEQEILGSIPGGGTTFCYGVPLFADVLVGPSPCSESTRVVVFFHLFFFIQRVSADMIFRNPESESDPSPELVNHCTFPFDHYFPQC